MKGSTSIALGVVALGFAGCTVVKESAVQSSQGSFIAMDADPSLYSIAISREEFGKRFLPLSSKSWTHYIGSRGDFHFFAVSDVTGFRTIYRITTAELEIEVEMPLTLDRTYWTTARAAFGLHEKPEVTPFQMSLVQPEDPEIDMSLFDEEALEALKEPIQ